MTIKHFFFVLLLGVLSLTSCRSTGPVVSQLPVPPPDFPHHSLAEILTRLPATPDAFNTLYAETQVALSSPEESGRFSTRIAFRRGDSLLIRIRFPLGIEGARVLVASDSAWIFDRINDEVIIGSLDAVSDALPGAFFGPNMVDDALDFIQPRPDIPWILSSDSLRYHLLSPDFTQRITVDPSLWRVVQVELRNAAGMVIEQRWYTDFRTINQHVLPLRLTVSRPMEDTRLSMALRKMDTMPDGLSFDLGLRNSTRRVRIRE